MKRQPAESGSESTVTQGVEQTIVKTINAGAGVPMEVLYLLSHHDLRRQGIIRGPKAKRVRAMDGGSYILTPLDKAGIKVRVERIGKDLFKTVRQAERHSVETRKKSLEAQRMVYVERLERAIEIGHTVRPIALRKAIDQLDSQINQLVKEIDKHEAHADTFQPYEREFDLAQPIV